MHDTNAPTNPARAGRVAILLPALSAAIWTALSGCSSTPEAAGPTEIIRAEALDRDTEAARRLTARGTELLAEGKYEQAESVLREACRHDLYFGPARNNLGLAYFHRGKYYEAAWEFDHAATSGSPPTL